MKNDKDIHREVEKTMRSLDGIERASTDDYFYSRLKDRIERDEETLLRPAWGIAALITLILINVLSVFYYADNPNSTDELSQEELTAFAETYVLTAPAIYEQNSNEE